MANNKGGLVGSSHANSSSSAVSRDRNGTNGGCGETVGEAGWMSSTNVFTDGTHISHDKLIIDESSATGGRPKAIFGAAIIKDLRCIRNAICEDKPEDDKLEDSSLEALLSSPESDDESSWISQFVRAPGHEFFCAVPCSFLAEDFNWLGLPLDMAAVDLLLERVAKGGSTKRCRSLPRDEAATQRMYGLIHARFIVTQKGLQVMRDKFRQAHFGRCPRLACCGQPVLPLGNSDEEIGETDQNKGKVVEKRHRSDGARECVKIFCPRCREVYWPADASHQQLNGAYWGPTFAHLFLLAFPELNLEAAHSWTPIPSIFQQDGVNCRYDPVRLGRKCLGRGGITTDIQATSSIDLDDDLCHLTERESYVPRIFGFRLECKLRKQDVTTQQRSDQKDNSTRLCATRPSRGKSLTGTSFKGAVTTKICFWKSCGVARFIRGRFFVAVCFFKKRNAESGQ